MFFLRESLMDSVDFLDRVFAFYLIDFYTQFSFLFQLWFSLIPQLVNSLPAMQEILVWFLAWEDPLGGKKG